MNLRKYLAIGLLATILTVSIAYGIDRFVTSNHLIGGSTAKPTLVLTSNATGVTTYAGDTFLLVVTASGLDGKTVTFYDNNSIYPIATLTIINGTTSYAYVQNYLSWDIYAEATYT